LRDVKTDAERGRIYLPQSELKKFNVTEAEILNFQIFRKLFRARRQRRRARKTFLPARAKNLPAEDRRSMVAAELMGSVYWRLLQKLERKIRCLRPAAAEIEQAAQARADFQSWLRFAAGSKTSNLQTTETPVMANPQSRKSPKVRRRLIVNADDFGLSHSINAAVIRAHRDGILTTASLMVNEPACAEAVKLARKIPGSASACTSLC
jgi:hypothetical protein